MRPPWPGWPTCWATGPPGGSCSATPSSRWPRNTDSGPGPSSARTSRAGTPAGDRPVSRLAGLGPGYYASLAEVLLADLRRNAPGALARLRAYVPRHAAADASTAELRDARLVIAREHGFPTWRELVSLTEKAVRDLGERQERWRRLRPQAEAVLAGDAGRLARLTAEQADALLHMLAVPEAIPGTQLGEDLGAPRAAVDVLIGKATNLDLPLTWAAFSNRVEYVRLLLGRRRRPRHPAAGRHSAGERHLRRQHSGRRPARRARDCPAGALDLCRVRPAGSCPGVFRCGRQAAAGPRVAAPYLGRTGLHWAIPNGHLEVIRLLMERGAAPSIRDELLQADADGWLHMLYATRFHDPVTQQIHDLIQPRSR